MPGKKNKELANRIGIATLETCLQNKIHSVSGELIYPLRNLNEAFIF
jgi:hypothetical protein